MERAAIIGVYDYIGYTLCHTLLDKGIEVEGIHIKEKNEHFFIEEKRLEIGRNANYCEKTLQEWSIAEKEKVLFISIYEVYKRKNAADGLAEKLLAQLDRSSNSDLQAILILPASLSTTQSAIVDIFAKRNLPVLELYLPTIFGPWQPEESFFQRAINYLEESRNFPELPDCEWTQDSLYIGDAVNQIVKMAQEKKAGKFLLQSGIERRWLECATHLLGSMLDQAWIKPDQEPVFKEGIQIITLPENKGISEGLALQKEHFYRIKNGRQ